MFTLSVSLGKLLFPSKISITVNLLLWPNNKLQTEQINLRSQSCACRRCTVSDGLKTPWKKLTLADSMQNLKYVFLFPKFPSWITKQMPKKQTNLWETPLPAQKNPRSKFHSSELGKTSYLCSIFLKVNQTQSDDIMREEIPKPRSKHPTHYFDFYVKHGNYDFLNKHFTQHAKMHMRMRIILSFSSRILWHFHK